MSITGGDTRSGRADARANVAGGRGAAWAGLVAILALGCSAGGAASEGRACTYPEGVRGYAPGEVPPPTLSWQGWTPSGGPSTISISDYHDCDGSKGITALLVDQSTSWCEVCRALAGKISEHVREDWKARGIQVLTLLTQGANHKPATVDTALAWRDRFGLEGTTVAADPGMSFRDTVGEELAPFPYELVIDPRTMEIVSVDVGYDGKGDFPDLTALAERNRRGR